MVTASHPSVATPSPGSPAIPAAGSPATATPARASSRETAVDVLRGWFLVSMTLGHLAYGSLAERAAHAGVWIDGAVGFVACSGLVLGLVYRRALERTGRVPYAKALRRARLLYLIQVAVLVLALAVASVADRFDDVAAPTDPGSWLRSLWLVVTLRLPAAHLDILPMYVLFLLAAVPATWLLARGRGRLVALLSLAVYALAWSAPDLLTPSTVHFSWAAWQLPFVLGLLVGWSWEERGTAALLRSRLGWATSGALTLACLVAAQAVGRVGLGDGTAAGAAVGAAFAKWELGPGRVLFAFAAMALGYAAVGALGDIRALRPVVSWLALLGGRSLDVFVIQCLAVILLPALVAYRSGSLTAVLLVAVTLLVATGWVLARRRGLVPGLRTGTAVPARPLRRLARTL